MSISGSGETADLLANRLLPRDRVLECEAEDNDFIVSQVGSVMLANRAPPDRECRLTDTAGPGM